MGEQVAAVGVAAAVAAALREAASVLWPVSCAGCGAPDIAVCTDCRALLTAQPVREQLDGVPLVAAAAYEGRVRQLVAVTKEHGGRAEVRALAAGLASALAVLPDAAIVRVPPSAAGMRRRGFDPVELVVRAAGHRSRTLRRVRAAAGAAGAQKQRTIVERQRATHGSLVLPSAARRALEGRRALVVDDIVTSGATVREAVRALRAAGCEPVGIGAVARTPRRLGEPLA